MPKILISDAMDNIASEILQKNNLDIDIKTNLNPEELKTIISNYDGLIVRSATKVTKEIINGGAIKFAELYINKRILSKNLTCLMYYCALNNDEAEDTFNVSLFKNFINKFLHFKI